MLLMTGEFPYNKGNNRDVSESSKKMDLTFLLSESCVKTREPLYTERYVQWCGRSATQLMGSLLPDQRWIPSTSSFWDDPRSILSISAIFMYNISEPIEISVIIYKMKV